MYEQFFGLAANPFRMTPDPHFLFLTPAHREALAGLIYSVMNRKGISLLIGEAGTGKTTLIRTAIESIPKTLAHFALVVHPTVSAGEFLELLLLDLGVDDVPATKARRLTELQRFLVNHHMAGRLVVLILDEAHKLAPDLLEEVRLLANFESSQGKLVQIVLSGQNELDGTLARQDMRQLKQRVAFRFVIQPLPPGQVAEYVAFRWAQAGSAQAHPFGEDTIDYLAFFSGGIPRVINAICDNALVLAYAEGNREVRPEHIISVAKDLAWDTDQASPAERPAQATGPAIIFPRPKPPEQSKQETPDRSTKNRAAFLRAVGCGFAGDT
jgi:general secretion pathway protein A